MDLGLKRALHEAAKGGYHRLVWTPGEKHAKRYNMRHHVDSLIYHPEEQRLRAFKDGSSRFDQKVEPHELPNYIGKDLAEKLMAPERNFQGKYQTLSTQDLELGGEGHKYLYDTILPRRLMALAKQHDPDAKLEQFKDRKGSPIDGFPSMPITEKMRQSILKRGFKAFKQGGAVRTTDDARAIRMAVNIAAGKS